MSKYTITIKKLIDNNFDFGLSSYPLFDEEYRGSLNAKILNHYYENEIGFETANLFKFYLNNKMNEIMPYYNILYNKQKKLLDNLEGNVNLTETMKRQTQASTETNNNSSSNSNSKNLFQDTPEGILKNTDIDNQSWATNLTLNKGDVTDKSKSVGESAGTEDYIKTIIGNNGNKYNYEVIKEIQNNLLNIDMLIINDLNELFMQIF